MIESLQKQIKSQIEQSENLRQQLSEQALQDQVQKVKTETNEELQQENQRIFKDEPLLASSQQSVTDLKQA